MNKAELEQYARENRKRLNKQDVKLGDVVRVLNGKFAGEQGVIVAITTLSENDFKDPYYEVELKCDVPEEYKVRKGSLLPNENKVTGGFNKCDFEVIGNYKPTEL